MKILVNALSARQGGGPTYIFNLIRHLPRDRYEMVILAGPYNAEKFRQVAGEDHPNLRIEVLPLDANAVLKRSLWEIFALPGYLKRNGFQIYYAPGGMMLTRMPRGIMAATALRNMWPWSIQLSRRYHRPIRERLKHWLYRRLFLLSYRLVDKVVFISRYSMSCVEQYYPAVKNKAFLMPHGLDEQFLVSSGETEAVESAGLKPGEYYLYVSQYNFYKSQKEVIGDWERLKQAKFPYPLVLAGRITDSQYGLECAKLIEDKKMDDAIIVIDQIPHEKLPEFLQNARAIVFASSCECCPNILLEKMASGRPVFCDTVPPMPEFGSEHPYYFDLYQPGDLARVILEAEKNPTEMERRGEQTRNYARTNFRWSNTIEKTLDFICQPESK